jgi:hypothetical protein
MWKWRRAVFAFGWSLVLLLGSAPTVRAGHLEGDHQYDSEIVLTEKLGAMDHSITITVKEGSTVLRSVTNGRVVEKAVPDEDCTALWELLLALPVHDLESADPGRALPDASLFTLDLRIGSTHHSFSTYDVDGLEDERYRDAIRAILALERKQLATPTE